MKKHLKILSILSIAILASCGGNVSESTSKPTDKPTINETSKPTEAPVVTETAKPTEAPKTEPATEKQQTRLLHGQAKMKLAEQSAQQDYSLLKKSMKTRPSSSKQKPEKKKLLSQSLSRMS